MLVFYILNIFMRKITFIAWLLFVFLIAWCSRRSTKKIDITDTSFNVESCDKYFWLLDCILDNEDDKDYTKDDRNELREYIKLMQSEWSGLDNEDLDKNCTDELAKFEEMKDDLVKIWCSL